MRAPRIYTEQALRAGASLALGRGPSRHIARVLRMRAGEPLVLFNGSGGQYAAVVTTVDKGAVTVDTGAFDPLELESGLQLQLGVGISRGERMDWIIQKATELGVSAIAPLLSERTGVSLKGERSERKLSHWQHVAIAACEQCGRNRLPVIMPPAPLQEWLHATEADLKLVLHHRAEAARKLPPPASIALLVGPEGGLAPAEVQAAEGAGFISYQLGPRILRTETAPLAAIAILQARWGDMSGSG